MSLLKKYLQTGGQQYPRIFVEKGEYVKDIEGNVFKVSDKMPTHDDKVLVGISSDKKVKKGKGGVELDNITEVVSSTTENRRKKDKTHTAVDESLKFYKKEGEDFIYDKFGFKSKLKKSVSPAGIIDATLESRDKFVKKFNNIEYRKNDPHGQASLKANLAQLQSLPELEQIFDTVFQEQEERRVPKEEPEVYQTGGSVRKKYSTLKSQTLGRVPSLQDLGITSKSDRPQTVTRNAIKDEQEVAQLARKLGSNITSDKLAAASMLGFVGFKKQLRKNISKFISEIDWGKWNREIPDNKLLLKEYLDIEQAAKSNGTWMKNLDGSDFKGTPEQFVQQQSENFKKAFPQGASNVYRGAVNHYTELKPNSAIFTADENLAKSYTTNLGKVNKYNSESDLIQSGVHDLYRKNSNNSLEFDTLEDHWTEIYLNNKNHNKLYTDFNIEEQERLLKTIESGNSPFYKDMSNFQKEYTINSTKNRLEKLYNIRNNNYQRFISNKEEFEKLKNTLGDQTITDTIASYVEDTDKDYIKLLNIVDGGLGDVTIVNHKPGNFLKSRIGNNGMFDMSNPNIYKTLVPIGVGLTAASNSEKKQTAGSNRRIPSPQDLGVTPLSDKSTIINPRLKVLTKEEEEIKKKADTEAIIKSSRAEHTLTPDTPKGKIGRALDLGFHPLTSFGYKLKNQEIPQNFTKGDVNLFDYALLLPFKGPTGLALSGASIARDVLNDEVGISTAIDAIPILRTFNKIKPITRSLSKIADTDSGSNLRANYNEENFYNYIDELKEFLSTPEGRRRAEEFTGMKSDDVLKELNKLEFSTEAFNPRNPYNAIFNKSGTGERSIYIGPGINDGEFHRAASHEVAHFLEDLGIDNSGINKLKISNINRDLRNNLTFKKYKLSDLNTRAEEVENGKVFKSELDKKFYLDPFENQRYFKSISSNGNDEAIPYLAELKEAMLRDNYIKDRGEIITEETLTKYIDNYLKKDPSDVNNLRILDLDISDENKKASINTMLKHINKLPLSVGIFSGLNDDKKQDGGYVIKEGDTLSAIAAKNKLSVDELAKANNIKDPSKIFAGNTLYIPESNLKDNYTIKKGDTLYGIAKKYNIGIQDLKKYNNLKNDKLYVGNSLKIPIGLQQEVIRNDAKATTTFRETTPRIPSDQVVANYYKDRPNDSYFVVDKKNGKLKKYKGTNLEYELHVGVGANKGDYATGLGGVTNYYTGAGIYEIATPEEYNHLKENPYFKRLYGDNIVGYKNEHGIVQGSFLHQIPNDNQKREAELREGGNKRMSQGCVNCKRKEFEQYIKNIEPGTKLYILPEDEDNFFEIKNDRINFTTNKSKDIRGYNFTYDDKGNYLSNKVRQSTYKPFSIKDEEIKTHYMDNRNTKLQAFYLKSFKKGMMRDLNIDSDTYDELARQVMGHIKAETASGYKQDIAERIANTIVDIGTALGTSVFGHTSSNISRGDLQIRYNQIPEEVRKRYGVNKPQDLDDMQKALKIALYLKKDGLTQVTAKRKNLENLTRENRMNFVPYQYNQAKLLQKKDTNPENNKYVQRVLEWANKFKLQEGGNPLKKYLRE